MALACAGLVVLIADVLIRRLLFPIALLSAVILRYNIFSLAYFLLLVVCLLLPGPRLKSQKASFVVYDIVVLLFSGTTAIAQALFQISIATGYNLDDCIGSEVIWRQVGFVQFKDLHAVHIVRLLLPDVIIFLASLISLCVNVWALKVCRKVGVGVLGDNIAEYHDDDDETEVEGKGEDMVEDDDGKKKSGTNKQDHRHNLSGPPYPATVQCYYRLPKLVGYMFDIGLFAMLLLSGVAVPSLTSFSYYLIFLLILIVWSVHLELKQLVRGLRILATVYATLHLVVLYLYQFQSAQELVPVIPLNTTNSLLARLFGLTPVILTDCSQPYALAVQSSAYYTQFLSPLFILLLLLMLCTDLRLWLFTPSLLFKRYGAYCLPVHDQRESNWLLCLSKRHGLLNDQTLWTSYGATGDRFRVVEDDHSLQAQSVPSVQSSDVKVSGRSGRSRLKRITWEYLWINIVHFTETAWGLVLKISFVFTIISMMAWSVLYPSWPSLVLLLWTCIIWLIPKINPRDSLLYTSPLLVLYALVLVLVQYTYSLNLTSSELTHNLNLGFECFSGSASQFGCKTWVLLVKTLFMIVFFASFHELVTIAKEKVKQRWNQVHLIAENDGEVPLTELHDQEDQNMSTEDKERAAARAEVYKAAYRLVSAYWILVVIGAFLLVTLAGPPSLLKTVYLFFFFLFVIIYQLTERFWFYCSFMLWWSLVLYAALDLVLVYTYQFDVISEAWERLYNDSSLSSQNITARELFDTVGLTKFDIGQLSSLIVSLVPPAVFIAVLATQLRYFTPKSSRFEEIGAIVDVTSFLPQFMRTAIERFQDKSGEVGDEDEDDPQKAEVGGATKDDGGILVMSPVDESETYQVSLHKQGTTPSVSSSVYHPTRLHSCYKFTVYIFNKTRELIVNLFNISWRFLELHLHKVVCLTIFAVSISQISALNWLLLLSLIVALPIPVFNPITYPLLTLYLGAMSISKMIYQTPLIKESYLNFTSEETMCDAPNMDTTACGLVFNSTYSPRISDATWIGFHKASNFADYIGLPIIATLLMSLWFSAKRHQARRYHSSGTQVARYESGSLFLGVTKRQADQSIISAVKYLINHFFEMYGVEVCWSMLAITVAVRIDVYGVIYCVALGVLLNTPRRILVPVWLLYLVVHGILLLIQYFFLLGAPPGICFTQDQQKVYPWSNLMNVTRPTGLKKWLFVSGDAEQILDKTLLYADFLVYLLVCLQFRYFAHNPLHQGTPDQTNGEISNYFKFEYWIDYIKVAVLQYSFWVSLFLMFLIATIRVSLFGLLYLLLGLIFLYRGQDMLIDKHRNKHRSWASLRFMTWVILFIRVGLQILDCVFLDKTFSSKNCVILLLFNTVCNKREYYGSPVYHCEAGSVSVGLWVDALNFIILTLQIIVFDTQYSDLMRIEHTKKYQIATYFRDIFDSKIERQRKKELEKRDAELQDLKRRAAQLTVTENTIDHLLYAGVHIPKDIELQVKRKDVSAGSDEGDNADTVSLTSEHSHSPIPDSASDIAKKVGDIALFVNIVKHFLMELFDTFVEYLEQSSVVYREVIKEISSEPQFETTSGSPESPESRPFADTTKRYGSTEQAVDYEEPNKSQTVSVVAEDHYSTPDDSETKPVVDSQRTRGVAFDTRGDILIEEFQITPSKRQQEMLDLYEEELEERVKEYSTRPSRLVSALYFMFLSHSDYMVYFLMILNIILNGSILSLAYAVFLFFWGLLSIPWPTRRFWLVMILYTMVVLVLKYCFQFYDLDASFWSTHFAETGGLYPPRLIGILHEVNFFSVVVWDVLLLIALLLHRGLLQQYGLWKSDKTPTLSNACLMFLKSVKIFFTRLLSPHITQGVKDYYTSMLFFDVLCFLTIVFGVNSFGVGIQGSSGVTVANYIKTNYIPLPFVIILLLQFLSMLVDRAIYLRRSILTKLVFQIILLVGWHMWLFFILPSDNVSRQPFTKNAAAQCIYFFKCCYFIVSSLQIAAGYPTCILSNFLTRSYDVFTWLIFLVYELIPLLPELRKVMDWVFIDTTLSLLNWLKVQEIYAQLYYVKVQRSRELVFPRFLGERQGWVLKLLSGFLVVAGLVLLIWGPLLVMSLISTSSQANPPVEVSIKLALNGYQPLVQVTAPQQAVSKLSTVKYNALRNLFIKSPVYPVFESEFSIDDFTHVSFPGVSISLWTISPPSRELLSQNLRSALNGSNEIVIIFSWSIKRKPSSNLAAETVSGTTTHFLQLPESNNTIESFIESLDNRSGITLLSNLYPTIIYAPANSASVNFTQLARFVKPSSSSSVSCFTILDSNNTNQEWWSLSCNNSFLEPDNSALHMYIYSEKIAPPVLSSIASIGVIGLYISVVFVIGRLIRAYISGLPLRLYIDEILNPDPLIKLCHDIDLVRECGDFALEEILVGKLFYIFASAKEVGRVTAEVPKLKRD